MPYDPTTGIYVLPTGNNPPFPGQLISTNTLTLIVDDIANALNNLPPTPGASIKIGTTIVSNGTDQYILYNNAGVLGDEPFSPSALTKANDTNVTLTLGGTPATALLQAVSLTLGWTGTLSVARGGVGAGTLTAHAVLLGEGTSTLGFATIGTVGRLLLDQGSGADPSFNAMSGDATITGAGAITVTKTNGVPLRIILTTATTFYVATTGNDSNNGLTSGTPWLTPQHAYSVLSSVYDFGGQNVTVQFAAGTYTYTTSALQISGPWTGGGNLTFLGDTTTPDNVVISVTSPSTTSSCFLNSSPLPGNVIIKGMKLITDAASRGCIRNIGVGTMQYGNIDFGSCGGHHTEAANAGAIVQAIGPYTISGGALSNLFAINLGLCIAGSTIAVTLTGTPAFSVAYAVAELNGVIQGNTGSFTGSATGPRYSAFLNGVIFTGGAGVNFFPGNSAGSTATGGQYA